MFQMISGHTALLEDEIDVSNIMAKHGFCSTAPFTPNSNSYLRKDVANDEKLDELGRLIRPWRVCSQFQDCVNYILLMHKKY